MNKQTLEMIQRLVSAGISVDDAWTLRRASMTLRAWFTLECGDSNNYGSWAIVRGRMDKKGSRATRRFVHDDDGESYIEHHHYAHGNGKDSVTYSRVPDREKGARKRIASTLARYPGLSGYVQTDPRGASLYILRPGDIPEGADVSAYYSRGIAVYK